MIPIRDTIPSRTVPVVTVGLIVVNVAVFLYQISLGRHLEAFVQQWGLVPARFLLWHELGGVPWAPARFLPFVSSMFLHGGWLHVGGNMLYLWIFGDNVEDRLGHGRFLLFYLAGGVAAGAAQVWFDPGSMVPMVGASGAIAGVLGAYFLLYPRARVVTLVPVLIVPLFFEFPAVLFLGIWFLMQFYSGTLSLTTTAGGVDGVAFWAHAGGFVAGMALLPLFLLLAPRRDGDDDPGELSAP